MSGNECIARVLALAALAGVLPAVAGMAAGTRPPAPQPPRARFVVAAAPTLVLGRGEAEGEFFTAVAGASRMPDGGIVVGDRGKHALLRFDRAGALQRRFARQGKGPGEVRYLLAMHRCGDTLVTLDIDASRLTRFTLDGRTVGSALLSPLPYRTACGPDGRLVAMGWERNEDMREGVSRSPVPYWTTDLAGGGIRQLGAHPGSERHGAGPLPLGREPRVAAGRGRTYVALADSMHVLVFDAKGSRLPPLRALVTPVPATDADLAAELEREVAMMGERARRAVVDRYRNLPRPRTLPATRDVVVDGDGNVWVQHYPRAASPSAAWTVFSPAGVHLGAAQMPAALEVYEIGRDYVLGRYLHPDDGVPEVREYRLTRR